MDILRILAPIARRRQRLLRAILIVNLALIAFADYYKSIDGQMLVFFVMVVAAAEVAVGLALIYVIFRNKGTVYVDELNIMKW